MTTIRPYQVGDEPVPGFRLVAFIGRGQFGEVWRASAPGGTSVAIKINSLAMKGALKEYRALQLVKQVQHPNLVPVLALWLKNERGEILAEDVLEQVGSDHASSLAPPNIRDTVDYQPRLEPAELTIAMGLGHRSLADRLQECRDQGVTGIPLDELLGYVQDAARALDYLNNAQQQLNPRFKAIQHCDVKPSNILIVGDAAQVCDFGLAREVDDARATTLALTPAYAAPEVIETNVPSATTDQYSLAVTYVELRTGVLPFASVRSDKVVQAHLQGALDLSRLSAAERAVIRRATARRPADRFDSVSAMVLALRDACYPRASHTRATGSISKAGRYAKGDEPVPGYRLTTFLGSGGFGEVWTATAPGGAQVAIKINKLGMKGALKEFHSLKLVKRIHHPNLVPILALWLKNEQGEILEEEAFDEVSPESSLAPRVSQAGTVTTETIAYEPRPEPAELLVAMGLGLKSLAARLEECRQQAMAGIPPDELLGYMRDVARALDYLNNSRHELGHGLKAIQHCDIKPSNILIVGDAAQVCDFGLAREVSDARATSLAMSLAYAAPEMIETNLPSPTTDQYSLAVSYHELRTGELPFAADAGAHAIIQAHLNGKLDLSRLSPAEAKVLARAMAREPADRYASSAEMVAALREACFPRALRTGRRWWAAAFVAGLAALALLLSRPYWPSPGLPLPAGFAAAGGSVAVNELSCPERIVARLPLGEGTDPEGMPVPLRLVVTRDRGGRPVSAFYVMEHPVSAAQFAAFARANPRAVETSADSAADEAHARPVDFQVAAGEEPQRGVSCATAGKFACWLDAKMGAASWSWNLPTTGQWDLATAALRAAEDAAAPPATRIREWTRTPDQPDAEFSKCEPSQELYMYIRGRDNNDLESVTDHGEKIGDVGFRFVVEVGDLR